MNPAIFCQSPVVLNCRSTTLDNEDSDLESKYFPNDLKNFLENHPYGATILQIYNNSQDLDSSCLTILSNIIILELIKRKIPVNHDGWRKITSETLNVFPTECTETFFVSPIKLKNSKKFKSEVSKGKFVDKYRNMQTFMRRAQSLDKKETLNDKIQVVESDQSNTAKDSQKILLYERGSDEVMKHWEL